MRNLIFFVGVFFLFGCQSAIEKATRHTKYSAYEWVGIEKRDLLKSRVRNAKSEQEEASEEFQNALDRLKNLTKFDGGDIEKQYRSLQSAYDRSEEQAKDVRESIQKVETISSDLFEEWEKEIDEISSSTLRNSSREKLRTTERKTEKLIQVLKRSEASMMPVLQQLKDQTLYLKHNLNAHALDSLKSESSKIQKQISQLLKEMDKSISQATAYIKEMDIK